MLRSSKYQNWCRSTFYMTFMIMMSMFAANQGFAGGALASAPPPASDDLQIRSATVKYIKALDLLVFEQVVDGVAGKTIPRAKGQLDGAPVLAYVFPTDLAPSSVGFGPVAQGILALAVTVHPDFDDTPLWDENSDGFYDNDGRIYHTHWVVLVSDERVGGGLSVAQFEKGQDGVVLPPTNPGMSIYLDSPGYAVHLDGKRLRVMIPAYRLKGKTDFSFDAATAYLQVNTSDTTQPMLGVHKVYHVLSGDLSLPYKVKTVVAYGPKGHQ